MSYPYVKVMGSVDSGLIIEADPPSTLAGTWSQRRSLVLSPYQSKELLRQMHEKFEPANLPA